MMNVVVSCMTTADWCSAALQSDEASHSDMV